jgi:type I restriction enzyme, S subunit
MKLPTKGTTPAADDMWQGDGGIRFLRVDNLSFDGRFDFNASRFRISPATHGNALARSRCMPGDVLTNIVGPPLGKLGLVTNEVGEINVNQAIALFRPTEELLSRFLLLWLGSSISQLWLRRRAKQTSGQVNLTLALCQELPLPCIALEEQQAIVARIETAQCRVARETDELAKLGLVKSGLMDDLLTGRVRVTPLLDPSTSA